MASRKLNEPGRDVIAAAQERLQVVFVVDRAYDNIRCRILNRLAADRHLRDFEEHLDRLNLNVAVGDNVFDGGVVDEDVGENVFDEGEENGGAVEENENNHNYEVSDGDDVDIGDRDVVENIVQNFDIDGEENCAAGQNDDNENDQEGESDVDGENGEDDNVDDDNNDDDIDDDGGGGGDNSGDDDGAGDEEVEPDDNLQRNMYILRNIKKFAMWGVSSNKIDEILRILQRIYRLLPRTQRTLLQTPRTTTLVPMGDGLFWYKGITSNLSQRLTGAYLQMHPTIEIDVHSDGAKLFKASRDVFWAILGSLADGDGEPFTIAVYHGLKKPPRNDFLERFVEEVTHLTNNGYLFSNNIRYPMKIKKYIMDAEARQFIKGIKNHSSPRGCEKCEVDGIRYRHRTIYLDLDAQLRLDEDFTARLDPAHHEDVDVEELTPLERLETRMVSNFVLDPLHLVDIGAFKRWLKFILGMYGRNPAVISAAEKIIISEKIDFISSTMPQEFVRHLRNLDYIHNYKALELRMLLLYVGLKAFKHLDRNLYENFLLFFCGIYILSDESLVHLRGAAELCIRNFVAHSAQLFGAHFVVYCVHCLTHLTAECEEHGLLYNFSAYKYESYLGVILRYLRSTYLPLQQLFNRDFEHMGRLIRTRHNYMDEDDVELSKPHNDWNEIGEQYSVVKTKKFVLSSQRQADSFFRTEGGDVATLINIVRSQDDVILVGQRFATIQDYFQFPMNSTDLGICKFSVVEDKSGGIFVVASKWISKDQLSTKHPSGNATNKSRLVMALATPKKDWGDVELQEIHACYGTYALAFKAQKKLSAGGNLESGLDTDYSKPRSRKPNPKYQSVDSDSDEDDSPPKPKKLKPLPDPKELDVHNKVQLLVQQAKLQKQIVKSSSASAPKVVTIKVPKVKVTKKINLTAKSSSSAGCSGNGSALDETTTESINVEAAHKDPPSSSNSIVIAGEVANTSSADIEDWSEECATTGLEAPVDLTSNIFTGSLTPKDMFDSPPTVTVDMLSKALGGVQPTKQHAQKPNNKELPPHTVQNKPISTESVPGVSNSVKDKVAVLVRESDTTLLQSLNSKVDNLTRLMNRVVLKLFPEEADAIVVERPDIPMHTEEQFRGMEKWLSERSNFANMQHHLFQKVKMEVQEKDCATKLMTLLFSNKLSRIVSWRGTQGLKLALNGSETLELLQCIVCQLFEKETNLLDFESAIKRWLNTSSQRKLSDDDSSD